MKYISSLQYTSPLEKLFVMTKDLNSLKGFETLTLFIESIILIDEQNFSFEFKNKEMDREIKEHKEHYAYFSSEQYYLTLDDNLEELRSLESKKEQIHDILLSNVRNSTRLKKELKEKHPILWSAYSEVKKDYGIERQKQYKSVATHLSDMNNTLLNLIMCFIGYNSFSADQLISRNKKHYKKNSEKYEKIIRDYLGIKDDTHIERDSLKTIPLYVLINIVKDIQNEFKDIKSSDINKAIKDTNLDSSKKRLKKLLFSNFDADFILSNWYLNIKKIDINHRLISIK